MSRPPSKDTQQVDMSALRRDIEDLKRQLRQVPSRNPVAPRLSESEFCGITISGITLTGDVLNDLSTIGTWSSSYFGTLAIGDGSFNAPTDGLYRIRFSCYLYSESESSTYVDLLLNVYLDLRKNGIQFSPQIFTNGSGRIQGTSAIGLRWNTPLILERTVSLVAGDVVNPTLTFTAYNTSTGALASTSDYSGRLDGAQLEVQRLIRGAAFLRD